MWPFPRRFGELIDRQLALFATDYADTLRGIDDARDTYNACDAQEASHAFGDYADRRDWAADDLLALRDAYAETLDADMARRYRREFARVAGRRFPELADAIRAEARLDRDLDDA